MRRIDDAERRARLGARHHLARSARVTDPVELAADLVGLHSSDPATVFLSTMARMRTPGRAVPTLERALYDDRALVRTLGMRRTMFVLPTDLVPVVQAACTDALVPGERRRLVQMLEEAGITKDGRRHLRKMERATLAELESRGEATGAELSKAVPGLGDQIVFGEGKTWGGKVGVSTRVLFVLSTEQRIARGRPKGSWTSSQYRWSPMGTWLADGVPKPGREQARTELTRRWLGSFGPATTDDLKWWTGWTLAHTRHALHALGAVEVELATGPGWVLADDEAPVRARRPWVALLPSLDPTTMGWRERAWYLGDHAGELFDRNGNAGPTVWCDGRVVGGWAQQQSGPVAFELLEDVGKDATAAIEQAAGELETTLGDVRIAPRFATPLEKRLRA